MMIFRLFLFFFSSRRRHTRSLRDWSSDVCSSDLLVGTDGRDVVLAGAGGDVLRDLVAELVLGQHGVVHLDAGVLGEAVLRSEERRVGKECRSRWSAYH